MNFKNFMFYCFYITCVLAKEDEVLYLKLNENELDPKLCNRQLEYIINDPRLLMDFVNSGPRIPKNFASQNPFDLGDYQRCLDIDVVNEKDGIDIKGKYSSISLYFDQSLNTSEHIKWPDLVRENFNVSKESTKILENLRIMQEEVVSVIHRLVSRKIEKDIAPGVTEVYLAVCVPKQCPTEQALSSLFVNLTEVGVSYTENYYRFKNDKPWVTADYVAIIIFAVIILLSVASTSYDLWQTIKLKSDPKSVNPVYRSFSVYTNSRRFLAISSGPETLECADGIRTWSMFWIILYHSYNSGLFLYESDNIRNWSNSFGAIWVTACPISVDTFFMLSGMLLVYSAAKKMTSDRLLKGLHHFYLHRYLRMFPMLATTILLQASLAHHMGDGPLWNRETIEVNRCRASWWRTLLYAQNYMYDTPKCLHHTWYLAVDLQLHILSPIILFWVLSGNKRVAWTALATASLAGFMGATIKNFVDHLPPQTFDLYKEKIQTIVHEPRNAESNYVTMFYTNTLTRASPFLVGMVVGYVLHLYRRRAVLWSKVTVSLVWVGIFLIHGIAILVNQQTEGITPTEFYLINSFSRGGWAAGLGLMIFACVKGYGGPINWFLSLNIWKLPSRLSYGMYLIHYLFIYTKLSSEMGPSYFNVPYYLQIFLHITIISLAASFVITVLIEMPFTILTDKLFFSSEKKTPKKDLGHTNHGMESDNLSMTTKQCSDGQKHETKKIVEVAVL